MSNQSEELLDLLLAGIILIILGGALAPLLPFNAVALGVILVVVAIVAGIFMAALAVASVAQNIG